MWNLLLLRTRAVFEFAYFLTQEPVKIIEVAHRKYECNCLTVAESRSSRNFKIFKKLHFSCPRHFKYPRIQISPRINKIGISFWTVQNLKISFWTAWYLEMDSCSLLLFTTNNVRFRHYRATIVIQNKLNLADSHSEAATAGLPVSHCDFDSRPHWIRRDSETETDQLHNLGIIMKLI